MLKCLLLLVFQLQWLILLHASYKEAPNIAMSDCVDHCGDVKIPYPFGIGANCFYNTNYEITCKNTSNHNPKPYLQKFNLEVLDINWSGRDFREQQHGADGQYLKIGFPALRLCARDTLTTDDVIQNKSINFGESPYRFSTWYNLLMVEGCGGTVLLKNRTGDILTGCASVCPANNAEEANDCYGVGCCQASFLSSSYSDDGFMDETTGLESYQLVVEQEDDTCNLSATLIDSSSLDNFTRRMPNISMFPMILEWRATYIQNVFQMDNVSCGDGKCYCQFPYVGNPFLPHGCQVMRECHKCKHNCMEGWNDNDNKVFYYCENPLLKLGPILGFSLGVGSIFLVLFSYWLYRVIKRKREAKRKAKYFRRNGGLLLQQQMSSSEGALEKTKIFRITELEKATNKFNKNRILGQGGQGTVYKGMLVDGKIVAVKKSKKVDESQLEQFINEVVILSQINHKNVVKLLGCCLETEVPLLVYEFIPNGTLYKHINDPSEEFHITWKMRLQIAAESADAIAYLHSSSSTPIYHRDIKSSNILLDEKYRAKVSDFGTSRAIIIEQTHVTTCVIGTYGYLDPEYFQSNQFTEKSDVYSFGVVLVELITGRKPICPTESGGWISLASEFLFHMESSRLMDILDKRILEEGKEEEFTAVANLAKRCLNMIGKERPTMKEITMFLNGIRSPDKVVSSTDPYYMQSEYVVTEISQMHSAPFGTATFSSDDLGSTSNSIEAEPLMANCL